VAKLIYMATTSLDGYIEDETGSFDWTAPDEAVHQFINDLIRPVGTHIYGRRMYETMVYWETALDVPDQPAVMRDFAEIWLGVDKIVFSSTLREVSSARTRIEPRFDPAIVRQIKESSSTDITIGGPGIAREAFATGLIDECFLFFVPIAVGGGKRALPADVLRFELLDERRFGNGTVYLRYRTA
jgi:dihydrofolate reductase